MLLEAVIEAAAGVGGFWSVVMRFQAIKGSLLLASPRIQDAVFFKKTPAAAASSPSDVSKGTGSMARK